MFKLEAGQKYKTRSGAEATLYNPDELDDGYLFANIGGLPWAYDPYSATGHLVFDGDPEHDYDLMELVL